MVLFRMVGEGDVPLSFTEPKNMIDVSLEQDSHSNADGIFWIKHVTTTQACCEDLLLRDQDQIKTLKSETWDASRD